MTGSSVHPNIRNSKYDKIIEEISKNNVKYGCDEPVLIAYHYLNEDGTLGSIIYLDAVRPTAFFNSKDLYTICVEALNYETEKRAFYIDGVDYTVALMEDYCFYAAGRTGQYAGFVEVDKDLYEILTAITGSEKYEGTFNSWLMLCYYEKTLSV